ncbi:MAG: hypothetical protein WDM81_00740 [Rhizomicrobium sp.]
MPRALVGEAMAECERLLRTSGELSAEAAEIRLTLAKTVEDVQHHLLTLPRHRPAGSPPGARHGA